MLEGYLGNWFAPINEYMRNEGKDKKNFDFEIDILNEIIICAPRVSENIVVYRGVDGKAINNIMEQVDMFSAYMEKGFLSTSIRKETVISEFPSYNNILKIYVPKGAFALCVDGIRKRGEEEMVFP